MTTLSDLLQESSIKFGTSGARGLVVDFTPNICAAFAMAFVQHGVASLQLTQQATSVLIGIDNRPSSYEIAQAVAAGLAEIGASYQFHGVLPTPALAFTAMQLKQPCIMVTGSHIPFERNGLKFYYPHGEIGKLDEKGILHQEVDLPNSLVLSQLTEQNIATEAYISRYLDFYSDLNLGGKNIGIYSHSSAGRDIYIRVLKQLDANVIELGRTEHFVPIDTEAVSTEDQALAREWVKVHQLDAIISSDGDGDRPLIADEKGNWLRGDILGLLVSQKLNIEALSIPVNCNSAVELSGDFSAVLRTQIGSPFVIEQFVELITKYDSVAGFEANGGYLLASEIRKDKRQLSALPTRDALLPILVLLAQLPIQPISALVKALPKRFTQSGKITPVSNHQGKAFLTQLSAEPKHTLAKLGVMSEVWKCNQIDGVRCELHGQGIIHFRMSGNAPEMRCYVESHSQQAADELLQKLLDSCKF